VTPKTLSTLVAIGLILVAAQDLHAESAVQQILLNTGEEQTVLLAFNEKVIVEMQSNPSTGYRWDFDQRTRERRCYRVTELTETQPAAQSNTPVLVGAPTSQKWEISLDAEFPCQNDARLSWTYHRPWESTSSQDLKATLRLRTLTQ
jgi:predicted secreted protein